MQIHLLIHKTHSRIENLTLQDIVNPSDLEHIKKEIDDVSPSSIDRAAKSIDHPLLLFIARQRKNLGLRWDIDNLRHLPMNIEKSKQFFEVMGGLQKSSESTALTITAEDLKIFSSLVQVIIKYPTLSRKMGFGG